MWISIRLADNIITVILAHYPFIPPGVPKMEQTFLIYMARTNYPKISASRVPYT